MSKSDLRQWDAIVVGAGFAGMYMVYSLRKMGLKVKGLEAGSDVGGTWYWNRYPGARCDVPSMEYSYKFSEELQQEWNWSEKYASQSEILEYANHVAERFDLKKEFQFETRVVSAEFMDERGIWQITTDRGQIENASYCIMATGALSSTHMPVMAGLDSFEGDIYHTGHWPHEKVDFKGQRVGVIGTGSSGIQLIPQIAKSADELFVFQRTPQFTIPARNTPLDSEAQLRVKQNYRNFREENLRQPGAVRRPKAPPSVLGLDESQRSECLEAAWEAGGTNFLYSFNDVMKSRGTNHFAAEFARKKIRDTVKKQEVVEKLIPDGIIGCKRICLDTEYFETYNQDNVTLVDIKSSPIDRITESGLKTIKETYTLDSLIFATGFDAMTGPLTRIDMRGKGGETIQEKWSMGPANYLGMSVNNFPNLFMICGPGSPSVLANVVAQIEQNVEWIRDCIGYLRENGLTQIEATAEAESGWVDHVNEVASGTLFPSCNSWYLGDNIPGKQRVFLPYAGGYPAYAEKCCQEAGNDYTGFSLS